MASCNFVDNFLAYIQMDGGHSIFDVYVQKQSKSKQGWKIKKMLSLEMKQWRDDA